ncbi:R3H domain-containing nucleic acid-binding protein [Fusobacterium sp. FSA-380-WT-3A]|uniref:Jag family protein n=1 Tax=Fusobacterium sp. FSA-380-WT-3A TaxID=2725304 RepID=UPI0014773250|nr:R3H domain-containing nucleic acid-binding protein [Fusobacterium sp. FSA-380-WT-3A]NME36532.1 KH domain-containing protein [Fusobacterium sp. FSA-380-WT-3A]
MAEVIEVKAMNSEEAKKRAARVLSISEEQIVDVVEKVKSKSFLGLFSKEGVYDVTYVTSLDELKKEEVKEEVVEEVKVVEEKIIEVEPIDERHTARDLRKERNERKAKKTVEKKEKPVKVAIVNEKKEEEVERVLVNVEPKEEIVEKILTSTRELIENMGLNLDVEFTGTIGRNYVINLSGEDKGIIIGKKGKTLNSFEYLLNSLIKEVRIEIDVEGFKEKRNETLVELANKMAIKAIRTRKTIRLNPMPPRERKIIHEIINQYPELDTYSEGKDPKRYIIIKRKR